MRFVCLGMMVLAEAFWERKENLWFTDQVQAGWGKRLTIVHMMGILSTGCEDPASLRFLLGEHAHTYLHILCTSRKV